MLLYHYDQDLKQWQLHRSKVTPKFYDANEDKQAECEWHLEVPEADIDMVLDNDV